MTDEQPAGNITVNRQQFIDIVREIDAFRLLEEQTGAANSRAFIELLYDCETSNTNPEGRYVLIAGADVTNYATRLTAFVDAEYGQVTSKHAYAAKLLDAASDGSLRRKFGQTAGAAPDLVPDPALGKSRRDLRSADRKSADRRDAEIRRACDWVCLSMHGDHREIVLEVLAEHVIGARPSEALGPTPALLDNIHARIAPETPQFRGPNPTVAYPSSIGGRYLLETVFEWTAEALWPFAGDERWLDVALFYLGVVGTVQGYPDGNKRIARMAYALTLLRGKHRFIAPSDALEEKLFQINGPTPGSGGFDPAAAVS